jgi:hypothetical protein
MSDPRRLLDDTSTDHDELALLKLARSDRMTHKSRKKILAGAGLGGFVVGMQALLMTGGLARGGALTSFSKTALGTLAAASAVVGGLWFSATPAPESVPDSPVVAAADEESASVVEAAPSEVAQEAAPVVALEDLPEDELTTEAKPQTPGSLVPQAAPKAAGLSEELALLKPARAALSSGDANGALTALSAYRAKFPNGKLGPEATRLQVEALVRLGRRAEAERLAAPLLEGNSPYAERMRTLLGKK